MTLGHLQTEDRTARKLAIIHIRTTMRRLLSDDSGQDLIEYALLLALMALTLTVAVKGISNKITNTLNTAASDLTSAA